MSNYELPLTISVSLQRGSEIRGAPNQQNRRRHLMEKALQYAMQSQSASCPPTTASYSKAVTSSLFGQERGLVRKVEPSLMEKKDGMVLERRLDDFRNQNPFSIRKDFQSPSAPHASYPFPKD